MGMAAVAVQGIPKVKPLWVCSEGSSEQVEFIRALKRGQACYRALLLPEIFFMTEAENLPPHCPPPSDLLRACSVDAASEVSFCTVFFISFISQALGPVGCQLLVFWVEGEAHALAPSSVPAHHLGCLCPRPSPPPPFLHWTSPS